MGSIDLQTSLSLKRLIEVPKLKAVVSRESEPQMFRKLFEALNNFFMHTLCCDDIKFFSQSESALSFPTIVSSSQSPYLVRVRTNSGLSSMLLIFVALFRSIRALEPRFLRYLHFPWRRYFARSGRFSYMNV